MGTDALALLAGDLVLVDKDRLLRVVDAAAVVVHRVIEESHLCSKLLLAFRVQIFLEEVFD